jgi:hypothetical protein
MSRAKNNESVRRDSLHASNGGATAARRGSSGQNLAQKIDQVLSKAVDLARFRKPWPAMLPRHRQLIVEQALTLLNENYVHLPMKRALYAIDPVQRLRSLLARVESADVGLDPDLRIRDDGLQREVLETFLSLRDPHTCYRLPSTRRRKVAFLPFLVEDIWEKGKRKYIVTRLKQDFTHPSFAAGCEVVHWSGVPIERAVRNHALQCPGSNDEARHSGAVIRLTLRALDQELEPDHDWVVVSYRTPGGTAFEERFTWRVASDPRTLAVDTQPDGEMNPTLATLKFMQLALFARKRLEGRDIREADWMIPVSTGFKEVFAAARVTTDHGVFGYLRIWSFDLKEDHFVREFIRLLAELPQNGLIIDIRENPGGRMSAAEYVLQTLTPHRIEPQTLQFINTPVNLQICEKKRPSSAMPDLQQWRAAIKEGLLTGAVYSAAYPKSDPEKCNELGQKYFGPVVLITDALSYSAADIFAAGFQDHKIGTILGTDRRTGGGGANRWDYERFRSYDLADYRTLPHGIGFRVAIRRSLRVKGKTGAVLEDFGVEADECHFVTRADVLGKNQPLINKAASLLLASERAGRALSLERQRVRRNQVRIAVHASGMTRFEVYHEGRPICNGHIKNRERKFIVELGRGAARPSSRIEIRGFDGSELVARYLTKIGEIPSASSSRGA